MFFFLVEYESDRSESSDFWYKLWLHVVPRLSTVYTVGIGLSIAGAFSHPTIEDDISSVQYLLKLSSAPLGICPYLYCSISAPPLYTISTLPTPKSAKAIHYKLLHIEISHKFSQKLCPQVFSSPPSPTIFLGARFLDFVRCKDKGEEEGRGKDK